MFAPVEIKLDADETALFWKCLPDKTLAFKGTKVEGRKAPKDRITILVAANSDGTDKLPLLILGKAKLVEINENLMVISILIPRFKCFTE